VNRPLAGTARRGKSFEEDQMLEEALLKDEKQCAEHIMLVDLGRNDVGKVSLFLRIKSGLYILGLSNDEKRSMIINLRTSMPIFSLTKNISNLNI